MSDVIDKAVARSRAPAARGPAWCRSAPATCASRAEETAAHRAGGAAPVPPAQRRPPLRRGRGLGGAGRDVARRRRSTAGDVREAVAAMPEVRAALERMWPVLTPAQLLHDLFGSQGPAASLAGARRASATTSTCRCYRPALATTSTTCAGRQPTSPCSTRPATCSARSPARTARSTRPTRSAPTATSSIDEVQDLTPMQLRWSTRRSLNGSHDRRRRHRPGHRSRWRPTTGTTCSRYLPDRKPVAGDRAVGRLPHPGADHGSWPTG